MILDEIIFSKRQDVTSLKFQYNGKDLPGIIKNLPKPRAFLKKGKFSLIAELKKASPSAGVIRKDFDPYNLAKVYEECGAAAISVLTDEKYFQGKLAHLRAAKESTTIPILRKDFIIDETQIYESRIMGADAVLLIARILNDYDLSDLIKLTEKLGLQALVEIHNAAEAERVLKTKAKIVGINNRDLDTLKVDLQNTVQLVEQFPELKERILISESGIKTKQDIQVLRGAGVAGVLIGETLLKCDNIPAKIEELIGK
ncbi:indole-3-glycerol phosphate synthase TrpC [Candidatus Margulisiibacteriota bacterium]